MNIHLQLNRNNYFDIRKVFRDKHYSDESFCGSVF